MKLILLAAILFFAGCAAPSPYPTQPADSSGAASGNRSVIINNPGGSRIRQDAYECEREAAMSGVAGAKAEAFNRCMRARGHLP